MALKRVFEAAGDKRHFRICQYDSEPYGFDRPAMIHAEHDACNFMMRCAENAGELMDAARDHVATVESLREHERLLAQLRKICDGNNPNALAHIAMEIAEFQICRE